MKRLMSLILILALMTSVAFAGEMDKSKQIPTRDEIEEQYRWNLADIYPTTDAWEKALKNRKSLRENWICFTYPLIS
jgi:oligoendopeptidase F